MIFAPLNIVHISKTPLVGAPSKLAKALSMLGHNAISIALNDYPSKGSLFGMFTESSLVWDESQKDILNLINRVVVEADIIHVHNDIPDEKVDWLLKNAPNAHYVYQVHSPLREGPLYVDRADDIDLPFEAKLVVGQYQPRHYPDYIPVPNIVLDAPSIRRLQDNEKLRIIFSPTHSRNGRWNAKYSEQLEKAIASLVQIGLVEIVYPQTPVHPFALMAMRRTCHITIDEIMTGAFHQVSIEGMCAGNVVINRADWFSNSMMANTNNSGEFPPFVYADESNIADVLMEIADSPDKVRSIQDATNKYYLQNMSPMALVKKFEDIYAKLS